MNKTKNKFSTELRAWRSLRPQPQAANLLDVPIATYRNWEQGRNEPSPMVQSSVFATMKRIQLPS